MEETNKNPILVLDYTQGLEEGPFAFDQESVKPDFVIRAAARTGLDAIVLNPGVAATYRRELAAGPDLVLKINGRTSLRKSQDEVYSPVICSLREAVEKCSAAFVEYIFYPGSKYEPLMLRDLAMVIEEIESIRNIGLFVWILPRGRDVTDSDSPQMVSYGARIALELGVENVILPWPGKESFFQLAKRAAGRTRLFLGDSRQVALVEFMRQARAALRGGACGVFLGKSLWREENILRSLSLFKRRVFG